MEDFVIRLAGSRFFLLLFSWISQIPFPYRKIPVRVHESWMAAHTLDRFAALLLWRMGWLEKYEHRLICRLCRPGMNLIDAGANIGVHTLQMSRMVGQEGKVWAFEPDSNNCAVLKQNLAANGCKNVVVEQAALSQKTEQLLFYSSKTHHGDHRIYASGAGYEQGRPAQAYALDDYFPAEQKIDFIKMDIQGAEGLALAGMRRLLRTNRDLVLLMEFFPSGIRQAGCSPDQVLREFKADGFKIFLVNGKKGSLVEISDLPAFILSLSGESYGNLVICRNQQPLDLLAERRE